MLARLKIVVGLFFRMYFDKLDCYIKRFSARIICAKRRPDLPEIGQKHQFSINLDIFGFRRQINNPNDKFFDKAVFFMILSPVSVPGLRGASPQAPKWPLSSAWFTVVIPIHEEFIMAALQPIKRLFRYVYCKTIPIARKKSLFKGNPAWATRRSQVEEKQNFMPLL